MAAEIFSRTLSFIIINMRELVLFFFLTSLTAYGQTIKQNIQTTKTDRHINIPGTRLFMVPPPSFEIATTFTGLQRGDEAMLMVQDLVGGNFYTNAATFSKSTFEERGIKVSDYQEIKINGHDAKYILMEGDGAKSFALVFGDTTYSVMIMGQNGTGDSKIEKDIIESFNTIYYDKAKVTDPFESAFFTIDDSKSKLKFFRGMASMFFYTIGGVENDKVSGDRFLLITPMPADDTMTPKSVAALMIEKQEQSGFVRSKIKNEITRKISGHDTYEAEIYGDLHEQSAVIYMFVVKKQDKIVCLIGISKNKLEESVSDFQALARTVNIK